jgi:DNA primase
MLSLAQKQSLEAASWKYVAGLAHNTQAQAYLAGRGITEHVAGTFRLGYVDEPEVGHEQYTGRLVIPYLTPTGVVDLRFRAIGEDTGPKYLGRPGQEHHLYNVGAFAADSESIALTEGEVDTIIVSGQVGIPCVGVPGANAWKPFYARAFRDYQRVYVICDGDQPGSDWGKRIAQSISTAVVIHLPDGMDSNDVYLAEGAEGIRRRLGVS